MINQTRIMLLEDDPIQQTMLASWLRAEGYLVEAFDNGIEARNYLSDHWADLMILDWDVPGLSGDKLLSWIRGRSRSMVPVIFQTVHSDEEEIVRILDTGADDFLIKPVDRIVFLARIRALLRRFQTAGSERRRMVVGEYILDRANLNISRGAISHTLGAKEFDLLWHLAAHRGIVVQRQDLHSVVWGWDGGSQSRSVDMYVSRLRARLKSLNVDWVIQSVYGRGYRLNLSDMPAEQEIEQGDEAIEFKR
ncbi:response regulator transcription factor [Trinickia caryophylli]|uniref:Two-component system, OmpR family, phosphate regulon response regulator PhoB n=1 Tax=Trinickia caryophylli TaxID=28094 RepID=A0A1X7EDF7_TRICW|nr:response regulator transcription factor [Trinickia caryophylli]PMS12882.1 DNA-binding response regulator [Trinickia caryophylli]TRX14634.1 response regulator transcription factor [Trinickia caryophylli]WQE14479.1 response regulator transcription factor [Trinickia caryophylli]SMF31976.1 two-component system, OmpR family, phosphate regulon response regulator PhoB [Trinickia caryophylli]GLU32118.1 DNA-binding response regulator [Trinickia caryophylli]